jgi:hypothetical protein
MNTNVAWNSNAPVSLAENGMQQLGHVQLGPHRAKGSRCRVKLVPFAFHLAPAVIAVDRIRGGVHRDLDADPAAGERCHEVRCLAGFRLLIRAQSESRQDHIQRLALDRFLHFPRHCPPELVTPKFVVKCSSPPSRLSTGAAVDSRGARFLPHIVPRDGFLFEVSWSEWQDL